MLTPVCIRTLVPQRIEALAPIVAPHGFRCDDANGACSLRGRTARPRARHAAAAPATEPKRFVDPLFAPGARFASERGLRGPGGCAKLCKPRENLTKNGLLICKEPPKLQTAWLQKLVLKVGIYSNFLVLEYCNVM